MERMIHESKKLDWIEKICAIFALCLSTHIALSAQTLAVHGFNGVNANFPEAALVQATNGDLYGTSNSGGSTGYGNVFEFMPGGAITSLYSFCSQPDCTDGAYPYSTLVQATNGDLYGTTAGGGTSMSCSGAYDGPGCGTVFRITPGGTLTTIYSFCPENGCADGAFPSGD